MLTDNILLITGASSEVGSKLIEAISENYKTIYAHYGNNDKPLLDIKKKIGDKIVLIKDDFSLDEAGDKIIDCIKNNGIYPNHIVHLPSPEVEVIRFSKVNWNDFEKFINISVRSSVDILQPILKEVIKQKKRGKVIFMLSSYTNNIPPKFMTPYITAKYAMLGLMKSLSSEYAEKGIMVNGISPGMMETKFLSKIFDYAVEENAERSPFGRNLLVEEIIPTISFLLSDGSDRITGQNIVISGGM